MKPSSTKVYKSACLKHEGSIGIKSLSFNYLNMQIIVKQLNNHNLYR